MVDDRARLVTPTSASNQLQPLNKRVERQSDDRPNFHHDATGPDSVSSFNHTRHRMSIHDELVLALATNTPTASSTNSTQPTANSRQSHEGEAAPLRGPFSTLFPNSKESLFHTPLISQQKFDWSPTEQGHILGAFFYGYIIFQIPGARMAELVGARW